MKIKSFFANTVEEAINLARREMGPDAMLLNSKRSTPEARHLGTYEVVVCCPDGAPAEAVQNETGKPETKSSGHVDRLSRDISELKQQMERLAVSLARSGSGMAGIASDPELSKAFVHLSNAELDADLAYEILSRIGSPFSWSALGNELRRMLLIDSELGRLDSDPKIVALVGPPGCGKTSALVKLAVQYGIAARKPTQILSVDTYRIAAADELRSYASILGVGCQVLDTTAALALALEEHRQKHLILIDTPGLVRNELDGYEDLARFLASYPGVDTHLVLPASMRTCDLKRVAGQYDLFRPRKLFFTRMDETQTFGPILSMSFREGKPISFLSNGQAIPEDLQPATADLILDLILKPEAIREPSFGVAAA